VPSATRTATRANVIPRVCDAGPFGRTSPVRVILRRNDEGSAFLAFEARILRCSIRALRGLRMTLTRLKVEIGISSPPQRRNDEGSHVEGR
jgi:hypothetical protein